MRLACVVAILLATQARAFVPGDDAFVVEGPPARLARAVIEQRSGAWHVQRDRDLGTVTQMWGSYVTVPGAVHDAALAERAARAFLARHLLPAGTRIADFIVVANRIDDGKRTVAFAQTWNGLRVAGGQMHVVFANDRLFSAGSDAFPNVTGTISHTRAKPARAAAWAKTALVDTNTRVVLPIVRDGGVTYYVADVFDAPAKQWDVYIAPDGAPIARRSRVSAATSTLQYDVGMRYASGARMNAPAPFAAITVDAASTTTDAAGMFSWGTSSPATVVPGLGGPYVRIIDDEANPLATASLTAQPGVPVVWSQAGNEVADAQISAFIYASLAKTIGRRIAPALPWLDQVIDVHVNGTTTSCNAFSTGDAILFYRASTDCENTARVGDVVMHEFGHSFHAQNIIPGVGGSDGSIVEGVADFYAANITSDSGVGRGFRFTDAAVRELDPTGSERIYPRDLSPVTHTTGLILGGTLWDLREQLGVAKTEKVFLGILQRAPDLTKTFSAALVADDDDGDLGNGTPNYCAIESAFGRHGLAGPGFEETSLAMPILDGSRVSVTVDTPTATACPPAQVTSMTLRWRVGTAPLADIAMTRQGASWTAELPEQPDGTIVEYQIAATLDTSETLLLPDNPADPLYQYFAGKATPIWCEHFDVDPAWKVDGQTEWDVAMASPAAISVGDPASAYDGTLWLGVDLRADGRYRSNTQTSIETPAVDTSAYGRVHLQFRRWLGIEDAALDVATIRINGMQIWANASNADFTLDHVDREWRFVDFDVTQLATEPLSVRWTLTSDGVRGLGGWNIDEVCLVGLDKHAICGDGILDPGEQCDDDTDGCSPTCQIVTGGGGGCCSTTASAEIDSFGSMLAVLALLQFASFMRRRASRRRPSRSVSLRIPK